MFANTKLTRLLPIAAFLSVTVVDGALAHTGVGGHAHGFTAGFGHPLLGLDHFAAMIAVGLWSSSLGGRALWAVPAAFVALLVGGAFMGAHDVALPAVENVITASVIVLGLSVALNIRLPLLAAAVSVGLFGIFHGYAHGAEMPDVSNPLLYGVGFVLATGLLQAVGVGLGLTLSRSGRTWLPRVAGGLVAGFGMVFPFLT
jgi:urease accessory protein